MVVFTILRSASSVRTPGDTLLEISQIYFKLDAFSGGKSRNGESLWNESFDSQEIAVDFCWESCDCDLLLRIASDVRKIFTSRYLWFY